MMSDHLSLYLEEENKELRNKIAEYEHVFKMAEKNAFVLWQNRFIIITKDRFAEMQKNVVQKNSETYQNNGGDMPKDIPLGNTSSLISEKPPNALHEEYSPSDSEIFITMLIIYACILAVLGLPLLFLN